MAKKTRETTTEVVKAASSSSASEEVPKKSRRSGDAAPAAASGARAPKVKKPVYVPSVDDAGHIVVSELAEGSSPDDLFKALRGWVTHMREFVRSVSAIADQCETAHRRLLRESTRKRGKRQVDPSKPKKLGTFTKLMEVPDNVCKFMGRPKGSYVSRVDVTTAVTNYINQHGLRVAEGPHKGEIRRDDKLNLVLAPRAFKKSVNGEPAEEYKTILSKNLQAWLSHNYKKPAPDDCQPTVEEVEERSRARKAEREAAKAAAGSSSSKKTAVAAPAPVAEAKGERKKRTKKNPEVADD